VRRGIVVAIVAVLGVVALVTGTLALRTGDDRSVAVGANVLVNEPGLIDANNSPSVVANPRRPENAVIVHRVDRPLFSAVLRWSENGGANWETSALPLPAGTDRPFAPDAAFAPDGTLYVVYVNLAGRGNVPDNLWLSRSSDGGRTLSPPTRISGRLAFQARLAVDQAGTVHVTWLQAAEVAPFAFAGGPNPVVTAHSSDGGRTFSSPTQVSDPERERVGAASPVIDGNGRLVVLYQDFKGDRRDFQNLEGPAWSEPFALVLTLSTDGGRSFARGVEVEQQVVPTRRFVVFLPDFPSLAAGPDDDFYVAWSDGRNGDEDVFLRRSTDGGRSWSPPVRVNDNRLKDGTNQYLPRVAVSPGGRVDVIFYDRRRDPGNTKTDAMLATSYDGGRSFVNTRVSSTSFDSRVGPTSAAHFPVDFGTRLGVVSYDDSTLAAWTDTRFGSEDTGRQDIVAARIEHG
jgi:hypothetical protein